MAMGYKTGQSRCLIDAAEREWKMSLPDPVPLSLLEGCSCLQLRNATIGFTVLSAAAAGAGVGVAVGASGTTNKTERVSAVASSGTKASSAPVVRSSSSSSLGSKKVRAVAQAAVPVTKTECTMILEGVTLDAHQKSKIAILGKNGCGKR